MPLDRAALAVGGIRLASGISFLVDPVRANRRHNCSCTRWDIATR
jgi:hypothetical protein